jgi:hypothetical protein
MVPMSTAVMTGGGGDVDTSAWPFPDHPPRWNPRTIGRAVIAIFVVLGLVAAGLLFYRLANSDTPRHRNRRGAAAPPTTQEDTEPQGFALENVTGRNYKDAEKVLKDAGLEVLKEDLESDEEKDIVVDMDPEPGTTVFPGDTVTLYVSTGPPKEKHDVVDDIEDSFTPPGQAKKDEKDGDD